MRVVVVLLALVVPMVVTAPPAGAATRFPLPSASSVRSGLDSAWAFLTGYTRPAPKVPVQESGTAAGRPHEVPAALTRAGRGNGRAPGKGAGQLPAYRVLPRKVLAGLSGRAITGFDARTSRLVPAQSTATIDTYQNADGSFTRRIAEGINALNQGLFARPGSQISDFIFYNVRLRGAAAGQYIAPCENCQWFIGGGG